MTKALMKRLEEGKLYYSISEVCQLTGLEQHVLRYWESEFPQLKPKKNRAGNRAYRAKEIKLIRYIKYLLYDEMYTVQGAKRKIADANPADLEGQVNLLGPLPGLGSAVPTVSSESPRRRRAKPSESETAEPIERKTEISSVFQPEISASDSTAAVRNENVPAMPNGNTDPGLLLRTLRQDLRDLLNLLQSPV